MRAKYEIQVFLRQLVRQGLSIIYISSEIAEVLDVSDRILVMHLGKLKGVVDAEHATQEGLLGIAMSSNGESLDDPDPITPPAS